MITPLDIQTKTFSNSPIGYKKQEVDAFKDEVLKEYEALYKEAKAKDEKIKELKKLLDTYNSMEETMKNTLIVAQSSAEQLTASAKKEAETIISEANQKSHEVIAKATEKLNNITADFEGVKNDVALFVMRAKSQLQLQIESLDKCAKDFEETQI